MGYIAFSKTKVIKEIHRLEDVAYGFGLFENPTDEERESAKNKIQYLKNLIKADDEQERNRNGKII